MHPAEVLMPRSHAFTKADIEFRANIAADVDATLIADLAKIAHIREADRQRFEGELGEILRGHALWMLAEKQEHPARMIAALRPGLGPANQTLRWLESLPCGCRLSLRAGNTESQLRELITGVEQELSRLQNLRAPNRLAGPARIGRWLRGSLLELFVRFANDSLPERSTRKLVADALVRMGVRFPDEKKNRAQFVGLVKPHSPARKPRDVRGVRRDPLLK
jgi:hypothetical protein